MKNYDFQLIYKKSTKKIDLVRNIITMFFLAILFVIVLLYGLGKIQILHILTDSSAPYHPAGSLAIEYRVDFDKLKVGDFITWSVTGGKSFVTHQIVKIDKVNRTVTTSQQQFTDDFKIKPMDEWEERKFDSPKTEDQYYGKVLFSINNLGLYLNDLKEMVIKNGTLNILGTMTIILFCLTIYLFSKLISIKTYVLIGDRR